MVSYQSTLVSDTLTITALDCVAEPPPAVPVVLPTSAPYEVRLSHTTTFYWGNFQLNASETSLAKGMAETQGPFGFGNGVKLEKNKSQVWTQIIQHTYCWTSLSFKSSNSSKFFSKSNKSSC